MVKCLSCGGTYEPIGADGLRYYHACPPVTRRHVVRAGAPLDVPLDEVQPTDTVTVLRAGAPVAVLVSALTKDDTIVGDTQAPRPNARDENIAPGFVYDERDPRRPAPMKAPGLGTTAV
jgi:antitoxin (DNA-binding transcriptional repressor) of toxin-antitoxin stability system